MNGVCEGREMGIPARFNGPPGTGNGGWCAGLRDVGDQDGFPRPSGEKIHHCPDGGMGFRPAERETTQILDGPEAVMVLRHRRPLLRLWQGSSLSVEFLDQTAHRP